MLRIAIIEDEPSIARNLHFILQQTSHDVELLTTLNSVTSAIEWLKNNKETYDLLFMDIRLSDGVSFDIFDQVSISKPVIFVTAYNEYALEAFNKNGIGYILKPFSQADVEAALNKWSMLKSPAVADNQQALLMKVAEQLKSGTNNYKQSFLLHFRDKLLPISTKDIGWFYSENEVTYANSFDKRKMVVEFTLEQLQQQLDPFQFFRANRQCIVNRIAIQEVDFFFNGRLLLKLSPASEENILISKARVPDFKAWMNS